MAGTQKQFPFERRSAKGKFLLFVAVVACATLLAPATVEASTTFNYTGNPLSGGGVITASVTLPCDSCPPGKYGGGRLGLIGRILAISMSYGSVTFSWPPGNAGAVGATWITLDSNGDVVDWDLVLINDFPFPPYTNFELHTKNTTEPWYGGPGISDRVLFTPAGPPPDRYQILEYNVGSPGRWRVAGRNTTPMPALELAPKLVFSPDQGSPFVIACDGQSAAVTFDARGSSDADSDPLTYAWFADGSTTAFSTGSVAETAMPLGTHTVLLRVSDGIAEGTTSVVLEVITGAEAIAVVSDLLDSASVPGRNVRPLQAALQQAIRSAENGDIDVAKKWLEAFQHKVEVQLGRTDENLAGTLIDAAQAVIDALNCRDNEP